MPRRENSTQTVEGGIFGRFFSNFDECRPELADDVSVDANVKFGDSTFSGGGRGNYSSRCRLVPFYALACSDKFNWKQLVTLYPADAQTIPHKCVQFRDPRSNRSEKIQPKSVGGGIFGRFSNFDK